VAITAPYRRRALVASRVLRVLFVLLGLLGLLGLPVLLLSGSLKNLLRPMQYTQLAWRCLWTWLVTLPLGATTPLI
jgi:hypothetical protein